MAEQRIVEPVAAMASLRIRWAGFALYCLGLLVAGFTWLHSAWQPDYAWRWLGLSSLLASYILWLFWRNLGQNVRQGVTGQAARLLPDLGPGNIVTLGRAGLLAALAGFLFLPRPPGGLAWIPGLLYTLAALLDALDGYLARVTRRATRLGETLDLALDGIGVLTAASLCVLYGQTPVWYVLVGLARYLWLAGEWVRRRQGLGMHPIPPNVIRRALAGMQMGFMFVMLWPVFGPPGTHLAAYSFGLPFVLNFGLDWLFATGLLKPEGMQRFDQARHWLGFWTPLALRALAVGLLLLSLSPRGLNWPDQAARYAGLGLPESGLLALTLAEWLVLALVTLGVAGRAAAVAGLCLLGAHQALAPLAGVHWPLIVVYTGLFYTGSGAYSLWKPEDRLLFRRAGE